MRGYVFMLESVFAGIILVGFMLYLTGTHAASHAEPERDFTGVLPELDQRGLLRGYVYSGDIQGIGADIDLFGYSYSVQVCDPSGSCTGQGPAGDNVWVSSYLLSGEDSYEPREVKLYVWEA